MLQSILDDVKAQFDHGNMVTRIILVNTFVLLIVSLVKVFTPPGSDVYTTFIQHIALNAETFKWLTRPWTFITHMFVHEGLWHFAWNMIMLYWFGRIVGDLIGDRKILPLYFIGGIAGALFYILWVQISNVMGIAYGASGAVMCFVVAAAFLAPEYNMRLLLIGDVKLKYVALGLVVIDILFHSASNPGGTFAHFGGALMG
ncbi:MAG: rhomboid family intramembrane serine protease, partial [Bacteroidota bacterium]